MKKWSPLLLVIFLFGIILTLSLDSYGRRGYGSTYLVKRINLHRIGKCGEFWMERRNNNDEEKWHLFAGNKCEDDMKLGRVLYITSAKNVTVIKGDEFDLRETILLPMRRKEIMIITKLQPFKKGKFWWKLKRR